MMKNILYLIWTVSLFVSCEKNETHEKKFKPIINQSIYDSLNPKSAFDYYEIRDYACYDTTHYEIISSAGNNPLEGSIIQNGKGVIYTTADFCKFNNIMSILGNEVRFWTTYDEIKEFLGPIDGEDEALFLAHLNGYYFKTDDKNYGIKESNGKYQLHAFKLVSMCSPVQTDSFLLEIDKFGEIKILQQRTYSKDIHACI
jgi:hypothetical protein